jgi:hypothetical protein
MNDYDLNLYYEGLTEQGREDIDEHGTLTAEIFTVEIFHLVAGKTDELIKVETDDRQFAENTAALAIHRNSWRLVSKNF